MENTTEQLKAKAYDLLVTRQQIDMELGQVNAEIAKKLNEENKSKK